MTKDVTNGVFRHVATAVGAVLTSVGVLDAASAVEFVNAIVAVSGGALTMWSIWLSIRAKRTTT